MQAHQYTCVGCPPIRLDTRESLVAELIIPPSPSDWSMCDEGHIATHYWTVLLNMEGRPEHRVHVT